MEEDRMETEVTSAASNPQEQPPVVEEGGAAANTSTSTPPPTPTTPALPRFEVPVQPSDPEQERQLIKDLSSQRQLQLGQTWYLVAVKWIKKWKEYTNYDGDSRGTKALPGPIDNRAIIEEPSPDSTPEPRIKRNSMEGYDYELLPENVWLTLYSWYNDNTGGPPLPRKTVDINSGRSTSHIVVEVRPLCLKIVKSSAINDKIIVSISKHTTVGQLKTQMCAKLGLREEDVRVWDYHNFNKYKLLENMEQSLESAQIIDAQPILLEEKDANGKFPEIERSRSMYSYGYYSGGPTDPGTTGLINLGNTCFMNSSLQCLSNTEPLSLYFLNNKYKDDINLDNPLGMKGELAEEYASLCKELWAGTHSAVAPRDFKSKLERFAPAFAGYQQHDSQELLSFLLDGLHEDLNRVKKKPYKDRPETQDQGEVKFAEDLWNYHKERNDSIIVDWFQGQLKSTLVCPRCAKVSITFDPVMFLSLPLPVKNTRIIYVTFFSKDPSKKATRYGCEVNKYGSVAELRKLLADLAGSTEHIVLADVYNGRFFRTYEDKDSLDMIQDRDFICGYELDSSDKNTAHYLTFFRRDEVVSSSRVVYTGTYYNKSLFGIPFVIAVPNPKEITYKGLYDIVYSHVQKYLKVSGKVTTVTAKFDDDTESDEEEGSSDAPKSEERKVPIFTIRGVDNFGQTDKETFEDNDQPLNLDPENLLLAAVFPKYIWEALYDETKEKDFEIHESARKTLNNETEDTVPLSSCIDLFTETEQLGPEDAWYCGNCKDHVQATKKFDLWRLPPILVVHLKRFSYKRKYWREKLETFVDYPIHDLDLSPYIQGPQPVPPVYELFAVSNHYGSLGGGHYTAYAQNRLDKKWHKFDDSNVSSVDESKVQTSSAYMLFYRRKDTITTTASQNVSSNQQSTTAATPNNEENSMSLS